MQWGRSHEADNSRAIRIGNKRPLSTLELNTLHGLGIHLRYHKRNPLVHPKGRAIVHHDGALFYCYRPKLLAYTPAGAEESNVNIIEAIFRQFLDGVASVFISERFPGRSLGGK